MRLIGTLPNESDARRLGDYLLTLGMRNSVESSSRGDWQVWIEHDDHVEQATAQLHQYVADPNGPQYAKAKTAARRVLEQEDKQAERRRRQFTDVRTGWAAMPRGGSTITLTVAVLCVVIFVLQQTHLRADLDRWLLFYTPLSMRPASAAAEMFRALGIETNGPAATFTLRDAFAKIAQGQLWRLVTPAFMHANVPHIVFNVWAFVSVGGMIEARKGRGTMLLLVLLGAAASCAGQATWDALTPGGGMGFVGLSGVCYAVFGYAWIRGRLAPHERVGLHPQTAGLMFGWLVLCMIGVIGPIANAAHVVGLLVGLAIGAWPQITRRIARRT